MPQTDFESDETLALYSLFFTVYFSLIVEDADDSNSLDEYITTFLQYAYYADEVCFFLDATLQRFFGLVTYYVLLQKFFIITRLNGRAYCSVPASTTKTDSIFTPRIVRYLTLSLTELKRCFNNSLMFHYANKNF